MKTASTILFLLVPLILAAQPPKARNNPCDESTISQMQMNACADFKYSQADARLNRVYRKAIKYLTDDVATAKSQADRELLHYGENALASLKESERAWVSYRDIQCKAAAQQYEGGSMRPMIFSACKETITLHRVDEIKSIYEDGDRKLE